MQAASEPTQAEGGAPPSQEAGMCKLLTDLDLLNRTMGNASHPLNDDHQVGLLLPTAEFLLATHILCPGCNAQQAATLSSSRTAEAAPSLSLDIWQNTMLPPCDTDYFNCHGICRRPDISPSILHHSPAGAPAELQGAGQIRSAIKKGKMMSPKS